MSQPINPNLARLPVLKPEEYDLIRDIVLPYRTSVVGQDGGSQTTEFDDECLEGAICYIGDVIPRRMFDPTNPDRLRRMLDVIRAIDEPISAEKRRFRIEHNGVAFRAQVGQRPSGNDVTLRALPKETPHINALHMPGAWREYLLAQDHLNGGLIIVSGLNGNGKTTTVSATLRSRLERFGGHANTCEDPIELPLDGPWAGADKSGYCAQRPADALDDPEKPGSGYGKSLYEVARQFPSFTGGGTILLIGEIRDEETALEAINAAEAGHLVLSTTHAPSAPAAIDRIVTLACKRQGVDPQAIREQLARHLSAVFHQRLAYNSEANRAESAWWDRAVVRGEVLIKDEPSNNSASKVAEAILAGPSGQAALRKYSSAQTRAIEKLEGDQLKMSNIRQQLNQATA